MVFDVELLEIKKAPSAEENAARFTKFLAALKEAADATCGCKDMACTQKAMMKMRTVRPPSGAPSPAQIKLLDPHVKRMRACGQKLMKGMGKPVPPPAPAKAAKPATK